MYNDDLIAYLQPAPTRFNPNEWRDVTGTIQDLRVESHRFTLYVNLPPGLYRCRVQTKDGAFDMSTAMVNMTRVPDGKIVPIGPWDLNHMEKPLAMAVPMARTYVNSKVKGAFWFDMPGPQDIVAGRLYADFGFEAEEGLTELTMEFCENDRKRMDWGRIEFMEMRKDNRTPCALPPKSKGRPSIYLNAEQVPRLRKRWLGNPGFESVVQRLRENGVEPYLEYHSDVPVACLVALLTGDKEILQKAKDAVLKQCRLPAWSGLGGDPHIMGGENDRQMGLRLLYTALAWDWLRPSWSKEEKRLILSKAQEYIQKMYDFTVLQRAYLGHPSSDPHCIGSWDGTAVACMAFYHDLPIARKALPFFHGLFCDSLKLFPPGGKMGWATFFPFFMMRYLAAANTFGGLRPELSQSPFLDNLGTALLTCFPTPNSQELGRGLRTVEHRYLTAFLCRFHPTKGIESIYQAFVAQEKKTAGDVKLGLFDLLYAPAKTVKPAAFPAAPLYARDIGDIIGVTGGPKCIGFSLSAGLKAGNKASFTLLPHNREYPMQMAALEVSVDGAPVLINNIGYGLSNALFNTMCFEDGGMLTQGQYLNGNIGPEASAFLRRCFVNDRFVYAHAVITGNLHPRLAVRRAERIMVVDLRTGVIVLSDSFEGARPIHFGTHLNCAGSVKEVGKGQFRLTGGQANLIAGIKGGSKGMSDEEKGELFVSILDAPAGHRVSVEEPLWIPTYPYGINGGPGGNTDVSKAKFPRYRRWRLEAAQPVAGSSFLFALSGEEGAVSMRDNRILLPEGAAIILNSDKPIHALGCECMAEAALIDEAAKKLVLIGALQFTLKNRSLTFAIPTDMELTLMDGKLQGSLFSNSPHCVAQSSGLKVAKWRINDRNPRSSRNWLAKLEA